MRIQKNLDKQNFDYDGHRSWNDRQEGPPGGNRTRKQRASSPSIFISKTFEILENEEYLDIIKWNTDGTSFVIENVEKFEQEVLPIYFRHRNFSSFVRQLNMYDFHKIRNQANLNIFEHKQFRKHNKDSLKNIKRKGCHGKKPVNEDDVALKIDQDDQEPIKSHKTVDQSKALVEHSETLIPKAPQGPSIRLNIKRSTASSPASSPFRKKLIEQFLASLPQTVENEGEIEEIMREMRKMPKYNCLETKEDLRKIVKRIKQRMNKSESQDLEDLSIEQEIIVENIRGPSLGNPSLAIFSTQKFLPMRSISMIGSLNFGEDVENLIYPC